MTYTIIQRSLPSESLHSFSTTTFYYKLQFLDRLHAINKTIDDSLHIIKLSKLSIFVSLIFNAHTHIYKSPHNAYIGKLFASFPSTPVTMFH